MKEYIKILSIAGSDSGGGAGIQADIKTISALGGYAATAITAVTAQNTVGVRMVEVQSTEMVKAQIAAVIEDIGVDAVKIGMLANREIVEAVADSLSVLSPEIPVVLDPVLVATSGDTLSSDEAMTAIIERLFPLATLLTPNIPEAERLTGMNFETQGGEKIAQKLMQLGSRNVLIKGGHNPKDGMVNDYLYTPEGVFHYQAPYYKTPNKHGTGCSLSSAIATLLGKGNPLEQSTKEAIEYVAQAIKAASEYKIGEGHGPIKHFYRVW